MLVAEDVDILINMFLCYMMGCQKNVYDFCWGKNVKCVSISYIFYQRSSSLKCGMGGYVISNQWELWECLNKLILTVIYIVSLS